MLALAYHERAEQEKDKICLKRPAQHRPCSGCAGKTSGKPGARVFNHYGMTEMGWAVELNAGPGEYHLREADLLFEVVDPESGEVLRKGRKVKLSSRHLHVRACL